MRKQHTEQSVIRSLRMKQDIILNPEIREIAILSGDLQPKADDLGNRSWGKIDYLCNHQGYRLYFTDEFPKSGKEANAARAQGWLV